MNAEYANTIIQDQDATICPYCGRNDFTERKDYDDKQDIEHRYCGACLSDYYIDWVVLPNQEDIIYDVTDHHNKSLHTLYEGYLDNIEYYGIPETSE